MKVLKNTNITAYKLIINYMFQTILDLIFPPVCGICGEINKNNLCEKCNKKINRFKTEKTLKSLKNEKFDEHFYFFEYKGLIRDKIIEYKFNDKSYLYKTISRILFSKKIQNFIKKYDVIIPVPISAKRYNKRGYNQSELIIKELIKLIETNNSNIKIKLENKNLIKIKDIKPQSAMSNKKQRQENIKGVYKIQNTKNIIGKNIIIFDDIFTTGSTVNECAKVLKSAGACKIRSDYNCKRLKK